MARLYRKGPLQHARLCHRGHGLSENRHGLVVDVALTVTPHVTQIESGRRSAILGRAIRHPGSHWSQRRRKRVEKVFGWIKPAGAGGKPSFFGRADNRLWLELTPA